MGYFAHFYVTLLLTLVLSAYSVFQEKKNPYEEGSLKSALKEVTLDADENEGLDSDTLVLYPDKADTFGVFLFVGGWSGIIPAGVYHNYLNQVAAHGFIVVGPWPLSSGSIDPETVENAYNWAKSNLFKFTGKAKPDFSRLAVGAHSAGADLLFKLLRDNKISAKAFVGMEPFSMELDEAVKFSVPGLFLGAELAEWSCSIPGFAHNNFYDKWKCPRVVVEAKGVGHCAILDEWAWSVCNVTQRCRTGDGSNLTSFRKFAQGYTAAFLMVHLQESPDNLKFVTDTSIMPFDLKLHKFETNC